jgi:hypothetical protein
MSEGTVPDFKIEEPNAQMLLYYKVKKISLFL